MPEPVQPHADRAKDDGWHEPPSWVVGVCGVAAVASALFSLLMFLNR
ncbi:MAG: hypothetical protein HY736_05520 [Verrucomicrobia bacterium]|nr:hypothetical protein [Verrucomicrobiota bacterium]